MTAPYFPQDATTVAPQPLQNPLAGPQTAIGPQPFQSPLAALLGLFSRGAGDELEMFFKRQRQTAQFNPAFQLFNFLGTDPTQMASAPVGKPAKALSGVVRAAKTEIGAFTRPRHLPQTVEDVLKLGADKLKRVADDLLQYEKDAAVEVFGKESAAKYERAQRIVNSSSNVDSPMYREAENFISRVESKLSPAQEARLFGIGETGPTHEEVAELARHAWFYGASELKQMTTPQLRHSFVALLGGERQTGDLVVRYGLPRLWEELAKRGVSEQELLTQTLQRMGQRGIAAETAGEALSVRMKQMLERK